LAFHVGQESRHVEELWGVRTNLEFVFHKPEHVLAALGASGFIVESFEVRPPYPPPIEAQTNRYYVRARLINGGEV